jgi:hypothetical protein
VRAPGAGADDGAAEGDPVPAWRPGGLAIRPALAAAVGDLAEISAVCVERIECFIAARFDEIYLGQVGSRLNGAFDFFASPGTGKLTSAGAAYSSDN